VWVPPECEFVCAVGAALLGLHRWRKVRGEVFPSSTSP
jgi:activator of 2-hydroxyglutaryl-CoA dehydratase